MTSAMKQPKAGYVTYCRPMLAVYDPLVTWLENRLFWKCPARHIQEWCDQHISANHLDVGVGTGYYLDHCRFPTTRPRIGLLDISTSALRKASDRLARYRPEVYRADVLHPIDLEVPKFDSISCNYLLHCLPGDIRTKAIVFEHLGRLLNAGGVLFGATLIQGGGRTWLAGAVMAAYNAVGFFSNKADDRDGLEEALGKHFTAVCVRVQGCAALFSGRR